jgi:hypothetical protein
MSTPPAALTIRPATADDAMALADIVNNMIKIGGTMAHITPFKAERLRDRYITPPLGISCGVAERNSQVLGFQALEWADQNWQGAGRSLPHLLWLAIPAKALEQPYSAPPGLRRKMQGSHPLMPQFALIIVVDCSIMPTLPLLKIKESQQWCCQTAAM